MIELLIKYIQDKGYMVDVYPGLLIIRKYVGNRLFSRAWGIFKEDLRPECGAVLKMQADRKCDEIEQVIQAQERSQ